MRKKLLRAVNSRQSKLSPKPIITFDNKDHSQSLVEPVPRKLCSFDAFTRHANTLRLSAAEASTACLANNQILQDQRMIALHSKPLPDPNHPNSMQWITLQYNNPQDYQVFQNPEILSGEGLVEQQEESISFPFIHFTVQRYNTIAVKFKNHQNIKEERQLQGFAAWAFQQSLQQLNGTVLLDWRVNHGNISFHKQAAKYFPKTTAILEEYVNDLKRLFQQYPALINKKEKFTEWRQAENQLHGEILPFENDYYRRLMKHYEREMNGLQERLLSGKERVWKDEELNVKIIDK